MLNKDTDLVLTHMIDIKTLQKLQDAFSRMTGMAALTTDLNGNFVTHGSNFTSFCRKHIRTSKLGEERCKQCDRYIIGRKLKNKIAIPYYCHAGLIDFAVPILVDGKPVGCLIGGQVLTEPLKKERLIDTATKLGIQDYDGYLDAADRVPIVHDDELTKAAETLYSFSEILSEIASNGKITVQATMEIQRAAHMKSDFLANMSHEIRTPMNAVIGMAEMALREELPPSARDYVNQIKSSGQALLTIINDILDFSKIESGRMDILPVEYEPMSLLHDVANIIMTRIGDKNVELIVDIVPDLPNLLHGDNIRIKQVLLNIANNAVKFTRLGKVAVHLSYEKLTKGVIMLHVSVEDTGIGIRKQDLSKLFQSFQQLDSKRNRNIEGTGLGLAITRRLLHMMDGNIDVKSEYEKGSTFTFSLPQAVMDPTPAVSVKEPNNILAALLISNAYLKEQMKTDISRLGISYAEFATITEFENANISTNEPFLFIEHVMFTLAAEDYVRAHPEITAILIIDFRNSIEYNISNLLVIKKPVYVLKLAQLFNHEDFHNDTEADVYTFDFTAPEAEVLIVDDNAINLTVAVGLLEPLKMKIDTALSGKEAISKISVHRYDIIFMDHMMPELDGIETTHIIRRFHEEYNDVPIIALTANAMEGTKEMFLSEGMDDFIAKPIELRVLVTKVRHHLPKEKIQKGSDVPLPHKSPAAESSLVVGDLDTKAALKLLGSEKLFWNVLKDYYRVIQKKADLIQSLEKQEDWPAYTIEVHALKSASRQIGAMQLAGKAADMEEAGNNGNADLIHEHTNSMLAQYRHYYDILAPFMEENKKDTSTYPEITPDALSGFFQYMREAIDNLDMDQMEAVISEMDSWRYPDIQNDLFLKFKDAVTELQIESVEAIMAQWEVLLK